MARMKKLVLGLSVVGVVALTPAVASAGEITGNGKPLWTSTDPVTGEHTLHGHSACAFSGQEDLQFIDPATGLPLAQPTKGSPAHSQSWGQIPKAVRTELTAAGFNPGIACNPTKAVGEP